MVDIMTVRLKEAHVGDNIKEHSDQFFKSTSYGNKQ